MKKRILLLMLLIVTFSFFAAGNVKATENTNCLNRYDVNCDGRNDVSDFFSLINYLISKGVKLPPFGGFTPKPSVTPSPKPTATSVPTHSVTPTVTMNMTGTPAPTVTGSVPPCTNHDPNKWHPLYDAVNKCHYDHEHGDDPKLGDAIFGPVGYSGTNTLSYPWLTSAMENTHKHGGYKYIVRTPSHNPLSNCADWVDTYGANPNCVVAVRVQFHIVAGLMDALARYHSYYEELKICKAPDYTKCGIFRMGGWADFGELRSPYPGPRVVRPGGTVDFGDGMVMNFASDASWGDLPAKSGEPYVAVENLQHDNVQYFLDKYCKYTKNCDYMQGVWSMNDLDNEPHPTSDPAHNQYIRFLVRTFDDWNLLDVNDVNRQVYFCRDGSCEMNGSVRALNEVNARIPSEWDVDKDGFVTMTGFSDRWGNPRPLGQCNSASVDCVPFSLNNVPVGIASTEDPGNGKDKRVEYDVSPSGVHWIRFPN